MDPRIPPDLQPLLEQLTQLLNQPGPGRCAALYVVGSLALGDFIPGQSDIDLLGVRSEPAGPEDRAAIRSAHAAIEKRFPESRLEAVYFQPADLGRPSDEIQPFLEYRDGRLALRQHFPLSAVTWWTLKPHGIPLLGPPASSFDYPLDLDDLLHGQRQNLNTYWVRWTRHPVRILKLLSNWGVQWSVLGVLRQVYTLREHAITSKTGAGEYALGWVPGGWQRIIREAIALRRGTGELFYTSRVRRAADAFLFLRYAIRLGNQEGIIATPE